MVLKWKAWRATIVILKDCAFKANAQSPSATTNNRVLFVIGSKFAMS
jgi:hypothetical protein